MRVRVPSNANHSGILGLSSLFPLSFSFLLNTFYLNYPNGLFIPNSLPIPLNWGGLRKCIDGLNQDTSKRFRPTASNPGWNVSQFPSPSQGCFLLTDNQIIPCLIFPWSTAPCSGHSQSFPMESRAGPQQGNMFFHQGAFQRLVPLACREGSRGKNLQDEIMVQGVCVWTYPKDIWVFYKGRQRSGAHIWWGAAVGPGGKKAWRKGSLGRIFLLSAIPWKKSGAR